MNQLLPLLSFLLELYHWLVLVYQALLLLCSRITSQAVTKPYLPTPSNRCSLVHVESLLTVLNVVCHICPLLKLCSLLCSVQLFPFTFCVRKNMLYIVDARAQLFCRKQLTPTGSSLVLAYKFKDGGCSERERLLPSLCPGKAPIWPGRGEERPVAAYFNI